MARIQYLLRVGIIPLFLAWRLFGFMFAYIATFTVPYLGHFSHPSTLAQYNVPQWVKGFAQFDGIFYLRIAQYGYSQFEQAFFPLYPILIKVMAQIIGANYLATSLLITNVSFLVGLFVFRKYLAAVLPKNKQKNIVFVIFFLLLFPTSFFFGASYTEGLFFLLVVSTLYFLHKKNYWLVALFVFLASLTRFIGVFLFIPVLVSYFPDLKSRSPILKNRDGLLFGLAQGGRATGKYLAIVSPFLGLTTYIYYLWLSTGNPLAFFTSQTAFGAGRSTQLILLPQVLFRYLKILVTARLDIVYFVAFLELCTFLLIFTALLHQLKILLRSKDKGLLGLNLFSFVNLVVPTFTGTLGSIPRYGLLSLSFFIYLGILRNTNTKLGLCLIFFLLHVALLTLFIQGYFVS